MDEIVTDELIEKLGKAEWEYRRKLFFVPGLPGMESWEEQGAETRAEICGSLSHFIEIVVESVAPAIAEREREACAKVAERERLADEPDNDSDFAYNTAIEHAAAAIRKRKG